MPRDSRRPLRSVTGMWRSGATFRSQNRRGLGLLTVGLLVAVLGACGADDRNMRPPDSDQTTTSQAAAPGAASPSSQADSEVALMRLSSPTFSSEAPLPARYVCPQQGGEGLSPQLQWSAVPQGTISLGLVVRDVDADGFIHWVATGIDPSLGEIVEGQLPEGAMTSTNGFTTEGWGPPCPPSGTHRYEFLLYALTQPVELTPDMVAGEAVTLVEATPALGTASLIGTVTAAAATSGTS
jgi:Raf kinase inhibitor-like YbhB/YbcL family protein